MAIALVTLLCMFQTGYLSSTWNFAIANFSLSRSRIFFLGKQVHIVFHDSLCIHFTDRESSIKCLIVVFRGGSRIRYRGDDQHPICANVDKSGQQVIQGPINYMGCVVLLCKFFLHKPGTSAWQLNHWSFEKQPCHEVPWSCFFPEKLKTCKKWFSKRDWWSNASSHHNVKNRAPLRPTFLFNMQKRHKCDCVA